MMIAQRSRHLTVLAALIATGGGQAACGGDDCQVLLGAPLMVLSVAPGHGAVNVDVDTDVVVAFSDALEADSAQTAVILRTASAVVACTVDVSDDSQVITLRPDAPLASATLHTITVANHASGVHAGPLGLDLSYRFTTR